MKQKKSLPQSGIKPGTFRSKCQCGDHQTIHPLIKICKKVNSKGRNTSKNLGPILGCLKTPEFPSEINWPLQAFTKLDFFLNDCNFLWYKNNTNTWKWEPERQTFYENLNYGQNNVLGIVQHEEFMEICNLSKLHYFVQYLLWVQY